ncbi:serine/threonine protein kinase [Anaerocolumna sp. MB42-C2]|uniref:serine/threonine protein kinase n=1 Tax=Anaerocolumna sp. MB42-C2 TaxID=3070997 RepID=UPI0027DF4B1D|nr:serine/threonine-protein kinase [Anaerocolumna sp. MB42-C2]WMJ85670.1 serine/threonine-protein kinase [Anaerocolumna sp. MB42-C2]
MSDQIWFQKYRIIKLLGRGGSAEVYLAEHIKLKTLRAIKRISKNHIQHEQLLNEAYILKNLKHSCIPVIYDFEEDEFNSYIIEQYIEGMSLKVFRQQYRHLKENLILQFTIQICDLLQYLYSINNPILYLDLKPENIIISDNVVKLIDFGASVFKNNVTERKFSLGTKGFAAPELYTGKIPDERTDVYGIGALIYYMAAGISYDGKHTMGDQKRYIKKLSKSLQSVIGKCLRHHSFLRYSSVSVLKNKLLEINHKKINRKSKDEESVSIAVAGTQHRIGVTHLSILITAYYNKYINKALYMEINDSNHISEILNRYQNIKTKDDICQIFNCNILPNFSLNLLINKNDYPVTIMDYGCLDSNNLQDYLKADIKLIISGGKEWELANTEEVIRLLNKQEDIKYLFNFLDGNQFGKIIKHMDKLNCYRIPYEPDPFMQKNNDYLNDFIKSLLKI